MNIKFIQNNKFKSNSISLNIPIDLDEKITDLNLLSEMIKIGSKKYDSFKKLYGKLQEMYGTYFNCYVNKCGEVAILTIYLEFLKDEYINEDISLWDDVIEFLHEIFFNVLEENGCFKEEFLNIEKENLRKNILSLVDSKNYYAYVKCEQMATKNEPYSNYIFGSIDRLDKINGKTLYEFYEKIKKSPYYFVITGNCNEDKITKILRQKFGESLDKKFTTDNNKFIKTEFEEDFERFDVTQTKLVINFKTPITIFDGDFYAFFVFNKILGSGYSKLYREVRQKKSLVYYINSYYEKFKGMLSIECGIDDKNFDITKDIILKEIENIGNGNLDEEDIVNVKKSISRQLISIKDKILSIHSFITPLYIFEKEFEIEKILEKINEVDKERIVNAAKQIIKSAMFSVRPLEGV